MAAQAAPPGAFQMAAQATADPAPAGNAINSTHRQTTRITWYRIQIRIKLNTAVLVRTACHRCDAEYNDTAAVPISQHDEKDYTHRWRAYLNIVHTLTLTDARVFETLGQQASRSGTTRMAYIVSVQWLHDCITCVRVAGVWTLWMTHHRVARWFIVTAGLWAQCVRDKAAAPGSVYETITTLVSRASVDGTFGQFAPTASGHIWPFYRTRSRCLPSHAVHAVPTSPVQWAQLDCEWVSCPVSCPPPPQTGPAAGVGAAVSRACCSTIFLPSMVLWARRAWMQSAWRRSRCAE